MGVQMCNNQAGSDAASVALGEAAGQDASVGEASAIASPTASFPDAPIPGDSLGFGPVSASAVGSPAAGASLVSPSTGLAGSPVLNPTVTYEDERLPEPPLVGDPGIAVAQGFDPLIVRLERMEASLQDMSARLSQLPVQIRTLGTKIDGLSSGLGEAKFRSTVKSLISIYTLVEQMRAREAATSPDSASAGPLDLITRLLWQALEEAGVSRINASGTFDPTLHFAVDSIPADSTSCVGQIRERVRNGFAVGSRVLQPAQVVVWGRVAPSTPPVASERQESDGPPAEPGSPSKQPSSEGDAKDTFHDSGGRQGERSVHKGAGAVGAPEAQEVAAGRVEHIK